MRVKSTWVLLAVFAGLGAYVAFVDEPSRLSREKAKEEEGLAIPKLATGKVRELLLEGKAGELRLEKGEGERWLIAAPWRDRADDSRVNALLADLKALKAEKEIAPAGADLRPFGLARPVAALTVTGGTPSPVKVTVGDEVPSGQSRYFRVDSGPVKATKSYALASLLADAKEFRSKEVVEGFPWAKLKSVEVDSPAGKLRLVKTNAEWKLESPLAGDADPDAAARLAEKLRWARISSFLEADAGTASEAFAAGLTIRFTAAGEKSTALVQLADVDGKVWARREGRDALFTLEPDVLEAFRVKPGELRRKKPVLAKTWGARRVDVAADGEHLVYEKADGAWRRDGRTVMGEESAALQAYLDMLESTQASEVVDVPATGADFGLDRPRVTAKLTDSEHGEQPLWVSEKDGRIYARAGSRGPVYRMTPDYISRALALLKAAREEGRKASH